MTGRVSVLHVLPHPGGGGETYVDLLEGIDGFDSRRVFLAGSDRRARSLASVARRSVAVNRAARGFDLVHVHGEVAAFLTLPTLATRPSVLTLHGLNLVRRLHGMTRSLALRNLRLLVRTAGCTICVSQAELEEVLGHVGAGLSDRVVLVRNGVDPAEPPTPGERAAAREKLGIDAAAVVAVSVGALESPKDPLTPALAAAQLARSGLPFRLLVAGEGSMRGVVEQAMRQPGGDSVELVGWHRDVPLLLSAADIFVLATRREGMPFSLLEAMAMGVPAVVSNVPGCVEVLGPTGIVVDGPGPDGFADGFRRLASDPDLRLELGARARARSIALFDAGETRARTRQVYADVLERRRRER